MKFTDEDLKRLKKSLEGQSGTEGFHALIARMEAAEWALLRFHIIPPTDRTSGIEEALDNWRKAAGK